MDDGGCMFVRPRYRYRLHPAVACLVLLVAPAADAEPIRVGAKSFTESTVLAQIGVLLAKEEGLATEFSELHGTRLAWSALLSGDIDLYPEYTGTIRQELVSGERPPDLWASTTPMRWG